jgi:hypothetical protein
MIEIIMGILNDIAYYLTHYWHWTITFFYFQVVKSSLNAMEHSGYAKFKEKLGIPDKWDWWFDPAVSHNNKKFNWIFKILGWDENKWKWLGRLLTPFSDFWHSMWTLWQVWFLIALYIETRNFWLTLCLVGIPGVYLIFNGIYAYLRDVEFLHIPFLMKKQKPDSDKS